MRKKTWGLLAAILVVTGLWTVTVGAGVRESVQPACDQDTPCPPSDDGIAPQGWLLITVGSLLMVSGLSCLWLARRTPPLPPGR